MRRNARILRLPHGSRRSLLARRTPSPSACVQDASLENVCDNQSSSTTSTVRAGRPAKQLPSSSKDAQRAKAKGKERETAQGAGDWEQDPHTPSARPHQEHVGPSGKPDTTNHAHELNQQIVLLFAEKLERINTAMHVQMESLQSWQQQMNERISREFQIIRAELAGTTAGPSTPHRSSKNTSSPPSPAQPSTPPGTARQVAKRVAQLTGNPHVQTQEEIDRGHMIRLQDRVHAHLDTLLGIVDWNAVARKIQPLTEAEVDSYITQDGTVECTAANFRVDFERPWKRFSFNKQARSVFIENFIATVQGGGMAQQDPTPEHLLNAHTVGSILDTYMDVCRRKYRKSLSALRVQQELEEANNEAEKKEALVKQAELKKQEDAERRQAAKISRRTTLFQARNLAAFVCKLPHARLLDRLGPRNMSDDETDGPDVTHQAVYRIVIASWQSEELRQFLWTLDRLWREHWAKPDNQRRKSGNMPRKRLLRPESKTEPGYPARRLWQNCYNQAWLGTLRPYEIEALEIIPTDYDLSIAPQ
ncbi:hypothetical protein NUW54_g8471 [Trametes sanguinea]|uniref:Uncharacterized protein n=1 Tax=Trametes sanguinea TaxID=158606 RepID=A0ACC1PD50_9APHY|nr:hypothetical protein NUW54_g8471 [Trametes sanguinea]